MLNTNLYNTHLGKNLGIFSEQENIELSNKLQQEFLQELFDASGEKFIISAEHIGSLSEVHIHHLKSLLDPYALSYKIIFYVRHPIDFAVSKAQQELKRRQSFESLIIDDILPKYRDTIEPLANQFGKENVYIRVFNPNLFICGDLICDFLDAIDESPALLNNRERYRKNTSLSLEAISILSEYNKEHSPLSGS
ncbi:MAG: hypothetical protein AAGA40_08140 [Cyanobacteria bacterium P01_E01_bin.45]